MKEIRNRTTARLTLAAIVLTSVLPLCLEASTPLSTLAPTNVTVSTATLRGSVTPGATATTVWFEWGPGSAIQYSTPPTNIGTSSTPVIFIAPITNLTPGTFYQCRAVASNSTNTLRGITVTFGAPILTLNGAASLTNMTGIPYIESGATASNAPVAIAVGDSHALALKADGRVTGWGTNDAGQLNITNIATNFVAIAAGNGFSLGLRADGRVMGWGANDPGIGQTVIPTSATNVVAIAAGDYHSLALRMDGTIVGWGFDGYYQNETPADNNYIAIAEGVAHSLALHSDGTITGWGDDTYWQISNITNVSQVVAIGAGLDYSVALQSNGTVRVAPGDMPGVAAVPAGATNIVAIAAGYAHILALRADGTVFAWGGNDYGELNKPQEATNVIAIAAGFGRSQALLADGTLMGWGAGDGTPSPYAGQTNTLTGLTVSLPVTITGAVNTNMAGTYPLLYRATNSLGFSSTATRTVKIVSLRINSQVRQSNGNFVIGIDLVSGKTLTVLSSTNPALPMANWIVLGPATESPANSGHYSFTDTSAPSQPRCFYRFRVD
jgi:alpha-tubulin suppressor-like RCC1 family protein